jgi:hypothetical protein
MIKLRKENKVIRVTENELEKYLANGYKVVEKPVEKQAVTTPEPKEVQFVKVYKEKPEQTEQPKSRRRKK